MHCIEDEISRAWTYLSTSLPCVDLLASSSPPSPVEGELFLLSPAAAKPEGAASFPPPFPCEPWPDPAQFPMSDPPLLRFLKRASFFSFDFNMQLVLQETLPLSIYSSVTPPPTTRD